MAGGTAAGRRVAERFVERLDDVVIVAPGNTGWPVPPSRKGKPGRADARTRAARKARPS